MADGDFDPRAFTPYEGMDPRRPRRAPAPVRDFQSHVRSGLLNALNPVSALTTAMDRIGGGRAARGLASGRPRELLSVIPGSDQFGLTDPADADKSHFGIVGDSLIHPYSAKLALGAAKGISPLLTALRNQTVLGTVWPGQAGQSVKYPGDHLSILADDARMALEQMAGSAARPQVTSAANQAAETAGEVAASGTRKFGSMMDLQRRGSRMYKQLPDSPDGEPMFRGVGGRGTGANNPHIRGFHLAQVNDELGRNRYLGYAAPGDAMRPGHAAVFQDPASRAGMGSPFWSTVRHERAHAIGQEAARRGDLSALPPLMRVGVEMMNSPSTLKQGLGTALDEAVAQGLGHRGLRNQYLKGADFLFSSGAPGRNYYVTQINRIDPVAGAIFQGLPAASNAVRGAAAVAPSALLGELARRRSRNEYVDSESY